MKKNIYIFFVMVLLTVVSWFIYNLASIKLAPTCSLKIVIIFLILFAGCGLGNYWWDYIYVQKKHSNKWVDKYLAKKANKNQG